MFWSKRTNPPFPKTLSPFKHCSPAKLKHDSLTSVGNFVINLLNQKPFNLQNGFWVGHQRLIDFRVLFYALFIPLPIRHANTVITILGLTSTRSSGRAYTRAPIFLAMDTAYLQETEIFQRLRGWENFFLYKFSDALILSSMILKISELILNLCALETAVFCLLLITHTALNKFINLHKVSWLK